MTAPYTRREAHNRDRKRTLWRDGGRKKRLMPTLLVIDGFRFFFSNERQEPPHVHVEKGDSEVKLWPQPVQLVYSHRLTPAEIRRVRELTFQHQMGRSLSVPIEWFPRLRDATPEQRNHCRLIGPGTGIHWPDLDEDISIAGLLGLPD